MADTKNKTNDEIDLLELFSVMWRGILNFFKAIIDTILFLFVFGIRRLHWLVIIILIGAATGYIRYKSTARIYSSEMIAQPNGFTSIDMAQYINDIHEMCQKNNVAAIANAFNISSEDAGQIANIEAFYYIDVNKDGIGDYVDYKNKFDPIDTTKAIIRNRILIRAEVLGNNKFNEVKEGLIYYINHNPYLLTVNDIRKRELKTLIMQTEEEIDKLDSLQNYEYYKKEEENSNRDGQIVVMNEKATQLYYRDKVSLLNARLGYEKALELATDPITIIKDFAALKVEDNPISKYFIKFGFFFGIFGYFILLIIAFRKQIIRYLSSKG